MARKVILDVDPGIDDAVALTLALFDPALEVVAVTAMGGNVSPEQATRNVQAIIEQLDPPRWPRIGVGLDNPIGLPRASNCTAPTAWATSIFRSPSGNIHPSEKVICDEVRAAPGEITIVCLGPVDQRRPGHPTRSGVCDAGGTDRDHGRDVYRAVPGKPRRGFQYLLRSEVGPQGVAIAGHEDPGADRCYHAR